jgi:hypothetical protein
MIHSHEMTYNCQGSRTFCTQNCIQQAQSLSALQQHNGSCALRGMPEVTY